MLLATDTPSQSAPRPSAADGGAVRRPALPALSWIAGFPVPGTLLLAVTLLGIAPLAGCTSTGGQVGTLQAQNRSLTEQSKAQLAEIENLKHHARQLEDRLIEAEQQLALMEQHVPPEKRDLAIRALEGAPTSDRDRPSRR